MDNSYRRGNHKKYLLKYHLILVCKYRKKLLCEDNVATDIKKLSLDIATKHSVTIHYMEIDTDHIHYMVETSPNINLSDFVRVLKQYTTYHIWRKYENYLSKVFWHERTFWSDGYFITSIGEVSSETLKKYIENQGRS